MFIVHLFANFVTKVYRKHTSKIIFFYLNYGYLEVVEVTSCFFFKCFVRSVPLKE